MVQHSTVLKYSLLFILFVPLLLLAGDNEDYRAILFAFEKGNFNQVKILQNTFYKKYPSSPLTPEVKLISVEIETDTVRAVTLLKSIIKDYPRFRNRDFTQYKICEIYYFTSKWKSLKQEADRGISLFGRKSHYYSDFLFFSSKASFYMHDYENSYAISSRIIKNNKNFIHYPELKIQNIFESQKVDYNSDRYASNLKISHFELDSTGVDISSLYLLGRHLEYKHKYNLAFSIYSDLINKYPRSPEALLAKNRIVSLKDKNPKRVNNPLALIKDKEPELLSSLSPTSEIENGPNENYYALNVGPFYNLKAAEDLQKQCASSFQHVYVVRRYRDFMVFIERAQSSEEIMHQKIRMAEEFGINAHIVYISDHKGLKFVHGE